MNSTPFLAQTLAEFADGVCFDDLPDTLKHEAKRSILNFLGCTIGSANDPAVRTAARILSPAAIAQEATIYGRSERTDTATAAFINAIAGNLLDYDDTHLRTVIHPSAPVVPPVLALAESRRLTGKDVIAAFVLGAEVECRLGNAVSPGHYARGWHITTTCGVFGSAMACANLLALDTAATAHALGLAASLSAGNVQNLPTAAKNLSMGNAARNGLLAALFAAQGYDAAPDAIEGPLGWVCTGANEFNPAEVTGQLGERWEAGDNTYKPYPAGIVMHAVIDACLQLRERHSLQPEQVLAVKVSGDALLLARGDRPVRNQRDAQVSIHHCVAAPLLWGKAGVKEFAAASVSGESATRLRARVQAVLDESLPVGAARVSVALLNGEIFETTVLNAKGSLERPMSDTDIEGKVRSLAASGESACDVDALIDAAWRLDQAGGLEALVAAGTV